MKIKQGMKSRLAVVFLLSGILLLSGAYRTAAQFLVVNEFSQGNAGAREYIELVVAGTRTCAGDSCLDIRGWIIDDNNGWCGAGSGQGIATGHMRFANDPNWSCVPYGSIILIYNSGDLNPSITLAPDPTDANNDNVYVVPSASTLLENNSATPISPSSATYVYPAGGYGAGGSWNTIGLANGGDAVIITDPANPGAAHYSIAYGSVSSGTSTVYKSQSGAGKVYYLTDDQYTVAASYTVGDAPMDETPGLPNGPANAAWITTMLTNTSGAVNTNISACINPGGSYNFNGTLLTAGGLYHDTLTTASLCDSIVHLTLNEIVPVVAFSTISGCNAVVHNGITYTTSTIVYDTVYSVQFCDSIYEQTNINIETLVAVQQRDTVSGCQSIVYKGVPYTFSQEISDTVKTAFGCDSIYKKVYLSIVPTPVITVQPSDTTICRGTAITLTATGAPTIQWEGYQPAPSVTVSPQTTTTYLVQATNELNCIGLAHATVRVVDFRLDLDYMPKPVEKGSPVTLVTSGNMDYDVLHWMPGSVFGASTDKSQYMTAGKSMYVTVVARSESNCIDTATIYLDVLPLPQSFLPTAFSPNGDGLNDFFKPVFVRDYYIKSFFIYNRWGQKVYGIGGTREVGNGWDGRFNGQICETGTYYYLLVAEDPHGEVVSQKGDVLLVR